ncbi:MAG TPA: response regulator [Actinomycetota bacterium]|jgi:signal transduction histidine kinase
MKILLVDDNAPIRHNLRQLLEMHSDVEIIGEGVNGAEAVKRAGELHPDVVLMDMNMPVMNGAEATKLIKDENPDVKVLALTAFGDMSLVSEMVKAGASGYLLKGGSSKELLESLRSVAQGGGALDKEVTRDVIEDMADLYRKEQERANALAELDRMKTEFISVVSHELRTPLTSIKGGVSTLSVNYDLLTRDEQLELLALISRQCDRFGRLIDQILTVSGIQRGGVGLRPSVFSLGMVGREVSKLLSSAAYGRDLRLEVDEIEASGDLERTREVALALLQNALTFTTGAVTLRTSKHGDCVSLSVIDEGPGMERAKIDQLLAGPFVQGDSSNTRTVGGLGLSLYIARQVLDASGGRLEVETSPEAGSTFTMVLPAAS